MSTHVVATHHIVRRFRRVDQVHALSPADLSSRLTATFSVVGGATALVGAWGGLAPFVGPTFGLTADGGAAWHWDLARAIVAALPGAAGVVGGVLVLSCARTVALGIGRAGIALASLLTLASGGWLAIGPAAWPNLWGHRYFVTTGSTGDLSRWAGFAVGPGLVLAALAGMMLGLLALRDRGRLVVDDGVEVRPMLSADRDHGELSALADEPTAPLE